MTRKSNRTYTNCGVIGLLIAGIASGYMMGAKSGDTKYPKPVEKMTYWEKHYYDRLDEFRNENQAMRNIVLVGSSHFEGLDSDKLLPGRKIVNRGIASDRLGIDELGIFRRLNESVFNCNPSIVFIQNGINDIGEHFRHQEPSIAEMEIYYKKIIEAIKMQRPDLPVVIIGLFPTTGKYAQLSPYAQEFNKYLEKIAKETGCPFMNVWEPYADDQQLLREDLTKDGLHLNAEGYKIWASQIEDMLKKLDPAKKVEKEHQAKKK